MMNSKIPIVNSVLVTVALTCWRDGLSLTLLLALVWVGFHTLPSGYWRGDDTAILFHALDSKDLSEFYIPSEWQKLSPSNFTPWITFSFKIDLWLAGLSPEFFYLHQLSSLVMVLIAAYVLCRQWVPPIWAFLAVCLFLMGVPTASVTESLMTRHYLEGMLFALLAVLAFMHALRKQRMLWAFVGALLYALAVAAKEVYVPLVLVVLAMPLSGEVWTRRLRLALPFIAVAVVYVFWRQYMLGVMVGGYAQSDSIFTFQTAMRTANEFGRIPESVLGPEWKVPVILLGTAVLFTLVKRPAIIPLALVLVMGVFGPLIPLAISPGISGNDRYLFLFWYVFSMGFILSMRDVALAITASKPGQLIAGAGLYLAVMLPMVSYAKDMQISRQAYYKEFDVQGRFFFEANHEQAFIPSQTILNSYWYVTSLCDIKIRLGQDCPVALIKGLPVNEGFTRLSVYDFEKNKMIDITDRIQQEIARTTAIDISHPLSVLVTLKDAWIHWQLGPYDNGQYYAASPMLGRFPVSRVGAVRFGGAVMPLHIQYESPQGWVTSSPLLEVRSGQTVVWEQAE